MSPRPSTRVPLVQIATGARSSCSARQRRVLGDRQAHARDARRVDVAHVLDGADRRRRLDVHLAALVAQQRAVGVPEHAHAGSAVERVGDRVGVLGVAHLDRDLADRELAAEVDRRRPRRSPPGGRRPRRRRRPADPGGAGSGPGRCSPAHPANYPVGPRDSVRPHARHPLGPDDPVRRRAAGRPRAADPARRGGRLRRPVERRDQRRRRLHAARAGRRLDRARAPADRRREPVHARAVAARAVGGRAGRRVARALRARHRLVVAGDRRSAGTRCRSSSRSRRCATRSRRCGRCCAASAASAVQARDRAAARDPDRDRRAARPDAAARRRDRRRRVLQLPAALGGGARGRAGARRSRDRLPLLLPRRARGRARSGWPSGCSPPTARRRSTRSSSARSAGPRSSTRCSRRGRRATASGRSSCCPEDLVREIFVFGSPEAMKERLAEFEAGGITSFSLLLFGEPERYGDWSTRWRGERPRHRRGRPGALLVGRVVARVRRLPRRGVGPARARRRRALRAARARGVPVRACRGSRSCASARASARRSPASRSTRWPSSATTTSRG